MKSDLKKSRLRWMILGVSLLLSFQCRHASAAPQEPANAPTVSVETYQRVLDLVFPRDPHNFKDLRKEFALTLRFKPSSEVEAQVNIIKYSDGRLDVVTYTLPKGSQSISEQLNVRLQQAGREDAEEMAKRIKVHKRTVSDTTKVRQLLERFATLRFTPQLDLAITLDGTGFQLWFEAVSNESYYSLVGGDPGQDRGDHSLVRWMNEVRQAVLQ